MRHFLLITLCLATLSACSCRQKPEQVAQAFLESFFASDYQQARVYATAQIADILDKTQSILDSLSQEEHQEVKSYLSEWIQLDLADTEAVCDFIVTVNKKYDNVALLINNAAISPAARLINMSVLDFNKVIDVDFRVPQMIMSGMKKSLCDGTIINIVSRVGIEGRIGLSAYGAAKELLIDYTKVMASEYAQHNIRMFGVNPGFMITDMVSDKIAQIQKDKSLIKQCMTPALSAKLILDLWLNTSVCGSIVNLDSRIYNTWST